MHGQARFCARHTSPKRQRGGRPLAPSRPPNNFPNSCPTRPDLSPAFRPVLQWVYGSANTHFECRQPTASITIIRAAGLLVVLNPFTIQALISPAKYCSRNHLRQTTHPKKFFIAALPDRIPVIADF